MPSGLPYFLTEIGMEKPRSIRACCTRRTGSPVSPDRIAGLLSEAFWSRELSLNRGDFRAMGGTSRHRGRASGLVLGHLRLMGLDRTPLRARFRIHARGGARTCWR